MKRLLLVLAWCLIGVCAANAQTGVWSGNLEVQGTKLPVVFHLDDDNPTLDSPAQNAKGIPMTIKRIGTDSISIKIQLVGASFKGRCKGDEIVGTFYQRARKYPLVLTPGENASRRPQTPRPPFPYTQEEVSFSNGDAVLKGTLTLPAEYSRETPVVIMVTGSGLQNRDEEIFNHKPFAVLADALARNGVASLRYDDRGFAESTGDAVNCTTEDLMYDALAGIDLLRQRFNKVGVLGHSEGGSISLMLGAKGKVDFIVSLAAMVVSGKETLLDQNRFMLAQAGYSQQVTDEYCALLAAVFEDNKSLLQRVEASTLPDELKKNLQAGERQLSTPYMQYFLASDLSRKVGNITCPVLALNGKKDTQVFYEKNLTALEKGLPDNTYNKIVAFDELNHMFQHCKTGSINEYATIEETISPEVLALITSWLTSLPRK